MTLAEIERNICRRLDKNALNLDAETRTRLDTFINDRYRELLRLDGITLQDETYEIATIAGQSRYALSPAITQVVNITNRTSGRKLKGPITLGWLREHDAAATPIRGTPTHYALVNQSGIVNQPTNIFPGALQLVSSHAADTSLCTLEYDGEYNGVTSSHNVQSIALTGIVPVVFPYSVAAVFRLSVAAPTVGYVELSQIGPPPLLLARHAPNLALPQGLTRAWIVVVWPQPQGVYRLQIDAGHERRELSAPDHEPIIPESFHTLLVWGGCSEECLKMDDNRRDYYEAKWREDVLRLRAWLHQSRGSRWVPTGGRGRPVTNLPGNYPASGD